MPNSNLFDIQSQFLQLLMNNSSDTNIVSSSLPNERIAIYRSTIMNNMRNSLSITYPGIWKLIGEDCAKSASHIFCSNKKNFPSQGCIDFWGEKFPSFLSSRDELSSLPYIEDYGKYEWLKAKAYITPSSDAISPDQLQKYSEEESNLLAFELQESVFLYTSKYPIDKIEKLLKEDDSEPIELKTNIVFALITKDDTHWLDKATYVFLACMGKMNISCAHSEAIKFDEKFDLTQALNFLFQNNLISKTYLMEDKNAHAML